MIYCTSSVWKVSKCRFGRQFKRMPVCQKIFWLHFSNPRLFICLFNKISLHCWRRLLGVILIWKQKVKNDMCHFASFSWIVAAKLAEVIFFALQIIGKSNNQGVTANWMCFQSHPWPSQVQPKSTQNINDIAAANWELFGHIRQYLNLPRYMTPKEIGQRK